MTAVIEREQLNWNFDWLCEKWSGEAVDFATRKLEQEGVTHIRNGYENSPVGMIARFTPIEHGITSAELRRLVGDCEAYEEVSGNLLLNEGIQRLEDLLIGAGGSAYTNAGTYIGVGDTNTAEAATQTELSATANAANRFYKVMNATFPSRASQTLSFQSDFTTTEANFAWAEWTTAAGATTASGSGFLVGTTNLNRKVAALGTKTTGTWTLTGTVVIS